MAGSSEEDRRRLVARYLKQGKHFLTREEELQQKQQAKARKAGRTARRDPRHDDEDDPVLFEKLRAPVRSHGVARSAAIDRLPHGTVTAVHAGRVDVDFAPARLAPAVATDPEQRLAVGDDVAFETTAGPPRVVARLPRRSVIARTDPGHGHRELVLAANVDLGVIVVAAADPPLRPGLIDRFLVVLQRGGVAPLLCVNKVDLLDERGRTALAATLRPYEDLAVPIVRCSASNGAGTAELAQRLHGRTCVFVGHSGVGKSSLLNAIEPQLNLRVGVVSEETQKGKHTTTTAKLVKLASGGYVVDTPGIRSMELWDIIPEEVCGTFRDLRPFVNHCRFPDCTHQHEAGCAVKDGVADGRLDVRRYESYLQLFAGDDA